MAWWRTVGAAASRKSILIAVAIGLLYFWWVTTQYERINHFNQRQLASAALVLKATIDTAVTNVRNYKYDERYDATSGPAGTARPNQVCVFDTNQPFLSLDNCKEYEAYKGTFDSPRFSGDTLSVVAAPTDGTKDPVTFHLQLASVFEEMASTDTFDLVFVINSAGAVRYQINPAARRWQNRLRWGERTFRDETASQIAGTQIQDVSQLLGADTWKNAGSVSSRTAVTLGGETAVLYLQPVPLGTSATEGSIVLGAVVPSRDVVWRALAMDTYFVALLFCALLFAVLGIPFIKLATLHAHERVTLRDARNLYVSAAGLLAVWIFGALAIDHYVRWQTTADEGLQAFAGDLSNGFETEIRDAVRTLDRYDDTVLRKRDTLVGHEMFADWLNRTPSAPVGARRLDTRAEYGAFDLGPSLFIERATWIAPGGAQVWKITSDKTAKPVPVKQRQYFQAVVAGNLYQFPKDPYCFFIAPDRSITDGKFYTFIAMRSRLAIRTSEPSLAEDLTPFDTCQEAPAGDAFVTVASLRLLSVFRPPLPLGYGFAIVNRDGRTLYHSDPRLSLREQFFSELGDERTARALTFSGTDGWLSTSYHDRPHRLYFLPLALQRVSPGALDAELRQEGRGFSGLYLVAFRDLSIEQAVVSRALFIGLAGPLLALLALVATAIWIVGRVSKHQDGVWSHWLWPNGSRERLHKTLAGAVGGILLLFVIVFEWSNVGPSLFLALPLVTAAIAIGVYAAGRWRGGARTPLQHPWWYAAKFGLLFVCLVGVPASTLFSLTIGHQFGKMIDSEEHGLWAQIDDTVLAVQSDARREQLPGWYARHVAEARLHRLGRWPAPFDIAVPHDAHDDSWIVDAYGWLDRQLPVRSELTARQWFDDSRFSYSSGGLLPVGPVAIAAFLLALAALVFGIRWSASRLFLADLRVPRHANAAALDDEWDRCEPHEKFVLMQVADEHIANPQQRTTVEELARKGLLILEPDLRPRTAALEARIRNEARTSAPLKEWEAASGERSWHSVRTVLFATIAVGGVFLFATQPGLQSDLAGLASGIVTAGGLAVKVRDSITAWIDPTHVRT